MGTRRLAIGVLVVIEIALAVLIGDLLWWTATETDAAGIQLMVVDRRSAEATEVQRVPTGAATGQPVRLVVDDALGDVTVRAAVTDTSQVEVRSHRTAWGQDAVAAQAALARLQVEAAALDGTVTVRTTRLPDEGYALVRRERRDTVALAITVPVRTAVEVSTRSGDLSMRGVDGAATLDSGFGTVSVTGHTGALVAMTRAGAIRVADVEAAGEAVRMATDFGSVEASQVRAETLDVESRSGRLSLEQVAVADRVELSTQHGAIALSDGRLGSLTLGTRSGRIRLTDLEVGGPLRVTSSHGRIDLRAVLAERYQLETRGADIDVLGARGALEIESRHGAVSVEQTYAERLEIAVRSGHVRFGGRLGAGPHDVRTEHGDVRLTLPPDSALDIALATEHGRITSAFPLADDGAEEDAATGERRTGRVGAGGARLEVRTRSGAIELLTERTDDARQDDERQDDVER